MDWTQHHKWKQQDFKDHIITDNDNESDNNNNNNNNNSPLLAYTIIITGKPSSLHCGPLNTRNETEQVKNPNYQEADQLAIYKRSRRLHGSDPASGQSRTWTQDRHTSSPAP